MYEEIIIIYGNSKRCNEEKNYGREYTFAESNKKVKLNCKKIEELTLEMS